MECMIVVFSCDGNKPDANDALNIICKGFEMELAVLARKKLEIPSMPAPLSQSNLPRIFCTSFSAMEKEPKEEFIFVGFISLVGSR